MVVSPLEQLISELVTQPCLKSTKELFVSFQLFASVHCVFPFVPSFPYYALLPSARFKPEIPFVSSSLSFQLFPAVCSVFPSDLISCVVSTLPFRSLRPFFHFKSPLPFVTSFLSHKLLCPDGSVFPSVSTLPFYSLRLRLCLSFVSILLFHLLLHFFRINSCPDGSVSPSVSTLPFYLLRLCLRINSFVLLV